MSISKLVENFKKFNYDKLIDECFAETKDILLDLIRSQLALGKKADGYMPEYKSVTYARKKGIDRVNLKSTGAFQAGFNVIQNKYSVRVRSSDSKAPKLLKMYGQKSLELNSENYSKYVRETILPLLQKKIRNELLSKNEREI